MNDKNEQLTIEIGNEKSVPVAAWIEHESPEENITLFRTEDGRTAVAIRGLEASYSWVLSDRVWAKMLMLQNQADNSFGIFSNLIIDQMPERVEYNFHRETGSFGPLPIDWYFTTGITPLIEEVIKACQNAVEDETTELTDSANYRKPEEGKAQLNPFNALLYYRSGLSKFDSLEAFINDDPEGREGLWELSNAVEAICDGRIADFCVSYYGSAKELKDGEDEIPIAFYLDQFTQWTSDIITQVLPHLERIRQRIEGETKEKIGFDQIWPEDTELTQVQKEALILSAAYALGEVREIHNAALSVMNGDRISEDWEQALKKESLKAAVAVIQADKLIEAKEFILDAIPSVVEIV